MTEQKFDEGRRNAFSIAGKTLSLIGVSTLLGSEAIAKNTAQKPNFAQDIAILNAAIALEHEGINAYTIGAQSGLLAQPVLKLAIGFQDHHKQHRDELINAVRKLGGEPVKEKSINEYAKALNADKIKNQTDILTLAYGLEKGAANAYLGLIPSMSAKDFYVLAARMAGDEAYHAAILANALNIEMPKNALMFG